MADFAAAQQRILERRALRESAALSAASQLRQERADRFPGLPPSLRVLAHRGLSFWDVVKTPGGTRPAFRVGQVDAELLDDELVELLANQAGEGLKLLGSHLKDDWGEEIRATLRAITWKLSIWDHGASYGASLQGLRYVDGRDQNVAARSEATRLQRAAYGLITVGGRYAWGKWEERLSTAEDGYTQPSPLLLRLQKLTTFASTTHSIAAFLSFLVFLYNGKYRTLTDRLLRLRLVPSSNQTTREVSFEYLNRQLVWHAFTEFLLFLLPLIGISRWKRWIARGWKKLKTLSSTMRGSYGDDIYDDDDEKIKRGELGFLPERTCAICYQDQNPAGGKSEQDVISAGANAGIIGNASTDITNPYQTMECACIYCFVCLAQRIEAEEGEGWTCLRCGEIVKGCQPWGGDMIITETLVRRPSRKSIAWADELVEKMDKSIGDHQSTGTSSAVEDDDDELQH